MKRRSFLLLALAVPAVSAGAGGARFERGVLWRVQRKGIRASHVFGTHQAPAGRAPVPDVARAIFERATSLTVESLPNTFARERFLEAARLPRGETLEGVIGAEDFARACQALGAPPESVNRLKPWAALLQVARARAGGATGAEAELLERAGERRLPVAAMEDVEEQIFAFDESPLEVQVALLKHSLAHGAELDALGERMLQAYVERDLEGMWRARETFIHDHPEVTAAQAVMTKRLVYDRSVVMAFRMQRQLRRGGAFIALGALHLYGAKGVLALLEQDGYRTARVV